MIKGLQPLGFDQQTAKDLFYAILPPRHRGRGYLTKQDWLESLAHKSPYEHPSMLGQHQMFAPEPSDAPSLARVNLAPALEQMHMEAPELGGTEDVLSKF